MTTEMFESECAYNTPDLPDRAAGGLPQHLDALVDVLDVLDTSLQKLQDTLEPVLQSVPALPIPTEKVKADSGTISPLSDRVDRMVAHVHELVGYTRDLTGRVYL